MSNEYVKLDSAQPLIDLVELIKNKVDVSDKIHGIRGIYNAIDKYWWTPPEAIDGCLTFASLKPFSISASSPGWDGIMEYSEDAENWKEWNGQEISGTNLYIRGTGNTAVTAYGEANKNGYLTPWTLNGSKIYCIGNIENLLDYATVKAGKHPEMREACYSEMFENCTSLVQAPELPATALTQFCYSYMFQGCTSLVQAPALPATTLTYSCYYFMFNGCTSLTHIPELPAVSLGPFCYSGMFNDCTSIKLSTTKIGTYTQEYRIPSYGTGTEAVAAPASGNMFSNTGGTFTGTPSINTTYYLDESCAIVSAPWTWGDDGAEVGVKWFAGLKEYLQTNSGASLTTNDGNPIVGTTKTVTLTTAVLGTTTHLIRIIGVDQDADNTVTWQTANCLNETTVFGESAVWIGSTARSLCQSYYDAFPGKASIKTVSKGTCANINDSRTGTAIYNNETVWLPSEREMGLDTYSPLSTANSTTTNAECTYGKNFSYSYYSSDSSRIKYLGDSSISSYGGYPWERSRCYDSYGSSVVSAINNDGGASTSFYANSVGLAPAFVIGN